jgi:hypothetical protein
MPLATATAALLARRPHRAFATAAWESNHGARKRIIFASTFAVAGITPSARHAGRAKETSMPMPSKQTLISHAPE